MPINYDGYGLSAQQLQAIEIFIRALSIAGGSTTYAGLTDAASVDLTAVNTALSAALAAKISKLAAVDLTGANTLTAVAHVNRHCQWTGAATAAQALPTTGLVKGDAFECTNDNDPTGANATIPVTFTGVGFVASGFKASAMPGETFQAVWDGTQWVSLSPQLATRIFPIADAATLTPDLDLADKFRTLIAGNRTLANPTNLRPGARWSYWFIQDAVGTRVLTWGSKYKMAGGIGTAGVLSTAANAKDYCAFEYNAVDDIILVSLLKAVA